MAVALGGGIREEFVLIVGGVAALTAIAVYLAWHLLRQWRAASRQRSAKWLTPGESKEVARRAQQACDLDPVP